MLPLNFFSIIALCVSRIHLPNTLLRKEILNTIPMCIHLHTYLCYCSNVFCFKCANNSGVDTKEGCKQRVRLDLLPCFSCNILGSGCSAPKASLRPLVKVVGWALAVVRRFCKVMAKWPLSVSVFIQDMMLWVFSSMKWTLTVCPRDRKKKKIQDEVYGPNTARACCEKLRLKSWPQASHSRIRDRVAMLQCTGPRERRLSQRQEWSFLHDHSKSPSSLPFFPALPHLEEIPGQESRFKVISYKIMINHSSRATKCAT